MPPVRRLNLIDLESDDVDWEKLEQGLYGKASRPQPFVIKEHQQKLLIRPTNILKLMIVENLLWLVEQERLSRL